MERINEKRMLTAHILFGMSLMYLLCVNGSYAVYGLPEDFNGVAFAAGNVVFTLLIAAAGRLYYLVGK